MSNEDDGPWEPYREAYRDLNIPRDIELNLELHLDQDLGYRNSHGEDSVRLPNSQYGRAIKTNTG